MNIQQATQALDQLCRLGYVNGADHMARLRAELGILQDNGRRIENACKAMAEAQKESHKLAEFMSKELALIWQAAQIAMDKVRPYADVLEELRLAEDRKNLAQAAKAWKAPPPEAVADLPKYQLGAILRYAEGSTAFFQVKQHALDLLHGGWAYVGQHIMVGGGMIGPIVESKCTPITEDERRVLQSSGGTTHIGVRDGVL